MAITRSAPSMIGGLNGELADRAAAPDGDGVAGLDAAVFRRHVARREDVA